jgi:hypothetical protein
MAGLVQSSVSLILLVAVRAQVASQVCVYVCVFACVCVCLSLSYQSNTCSLLLQHLLTPTPTRSQRVVPWQHLIPATPAPFHDNTYSHLRQHLIATSRSVCVSQTSVPRGHGEVAPPNIPGFLSSAPSRPSVLALLNVGKHTDHIYPQHWYSGSEGSLLFPG